MAKTSHELAIEFAVEITELCSKIKGRPEYTKQLIRSASSISANIAEAKYAESNADFVHKLEIAQKEANETETWLSVLCKSDIIDDLTFKPSPLCIHVGHTYLIVNIFPLHITLLF